MTTAWHPGQRAVIDRRQVVTIDRVTPSGRAVVGCRTFNEDGTERAAGDSIRRSRLELLTPEIEAKMALIERWDAAQAPAFRAADDAERFMRQTFQRWGRRTPKPEDLDRAERLTAAIRTVLDAPGEAQRQMPRDRGDG
jgi:hypothetical protein